MPAPTALLHPQPASEVPLPPADEDEELLLDAPGAIPSQVDVPKTPVENEDTEMVMDEEGRPRFPAASAQNTIRRIETRKVSIPPHRMTPLKKAWPQIYPPLVEHLKLQVVRVTKTIRSFVNLHRSCALGNAD